MRQIESEASDSDQRDESGELHKRRHSSPAVNLGDETSSHSTSFQVGGDQPVAAEQPPLVPLIGRRLTETAETMMLGMQARIASRATERSRALRARQRRHERRQEQKAAKTLSAILLAFIITWTPYNVFAIMQTFCADCVHQHLYEFGELSQSVYGGCPEKPPPFFIFTKTSPLCVSI